MPIQYKHKRHNIRNEVKSPYFWTRTRLKFLPFREQPDAVYKLILRWRGFRHLSNDYYISADFMGYTKFLTKHKARPKVYPKNIW